MKILYIENARIPTEKAHGIQIMKMCEAFTNYSGEVELVLPTRKNKDFKNTDFFKYYGVRNNFKIKKVFSFDPYFLIKFPQGIYIKFQIFFYCLSLFFLLLFKINKKDYIFFTRDEYLLPLLQLFSKKTVWEAHNLPKNQKKYLKSWQKCLKIIAISKALKNDLALLGIKADKILVAHDGVDLNSFNIQDDKEEIRKKLNLPLDKKIILYTGHFYEWKGVQTMARATKELPEFLFVFVGGGDHKFEEFKNKNNSENIFYTGYKNPTEIPYYLKSADVLILPNSKKDVRSKYTSPLKLFEYMASGVPIVASNLENFKEILNDENSVFFVPDNSEDLAEKIKQVLDNENLSQKISNQALQDVQKYTWQKRAEKIINFIK